MTAKDRLISLRAFLDFYQDKYNSISFIPNDPISVPHRYSLLQDVEIAGFWTAMLSWGRRQTIIKKAIELMNIMGDSPYEFILNHKEKDRVRFQCFVHRTFQYTDTLYFLEFLQHFYRSHESLEEAFLSPENTLDPVFNGLIRFHNSFFSLPNSPARTRKHVSTPARGSTCKRLNMFLRWMVRDDNNGVDFGIWKRIEPHQLYIPLDLHVDKVARSLGLLKRKQTDWLAVCELTDLLRSFDAVDPVKYDFALFGIGILEPQDVAQRRWCSSTPSAGQI